MTVANDISEMKYDLEILNMLRCHLVPKLILKLLLHLYEVFLPVFSTLFNQCGGNIRWMG